MSDTTQLLIIAAIAAPILWLCSRPRRVWFDGVGKIAAYRQISKAEIKRERL